MDDWLGRGLWLFLVWSWVILLLAFIPLFSGILLIYLGFWTWPIERELDRVTAERDRLKEEMDRAKEEDRLVAKVVLRAKDTSTPSRTVEVRRRVRT